MNFAE